MRRAEAGGRRATTAPFTVALRSTLSALLLITGCVPGYKNPPDTPNQSRQIATVSLTPQGESLRLAVVGDIHQKFEEPNRGNGARVGNAIREHARRERIDAILLLGDNFDPCGVTSKNDLKWDLLRRMFDAAGVPVFPVLGNHDYGNPKWRYGKLWVCGDPNPLAELGQVNSPNWRFPSRSYRIQSGFADFFMIDSTPIAAGMDEPLLGSATSDEILEWLRRDIPAVKGWRIVAGHHHVLASGKERRRSAATHERMQELRKVFVDAGADLYMSGHRHHLELIVPAAGERHPILLVSGAGGHPRALQDVRKGSPRSVFPAAPPQGHPGFAVVDLTPDKLGVMFYDADARPVSRRFEFPRRAR